MPKHSQEMIAAADELLRQFAQTAEDDLSAILYVARPRSLSDLRQFRPEIQ